MLTAALRPIRTDAALLQVLDTLVGVFHSTMILATGDAGNNCK